MKKSTKKIPININKVSLQTMNFSMSHRLFFCFIAGILIGTVIINFMADEYIGNIEICNRYFIGEGGWQSQVSKRAFFLYCIKKYAIDMLVIVSLNCTSIWRKFDYIYCIYKGVAVSVLVSVATVTYGTGGLLIYVMTIFPHYFVYIPFIIFTLFLGIKLREKMHTDKFGLILVKGAVIEMFLIIITSFLEAYCNYPLIRDMLSQ